MSLNGYKSPTHAIPSMYSLNIEHDGAVWLCDTHSAMKQCISLSISLS